MERVARLVTSRPGMLFVSLSCTVLALWLAVRNLDAQEVLDALRGLSAWPFVLSFFCLILATVVRGLRFHVLMRRTGSSPFSTSNDDAS